jgi:hypothetical protein
MFVGVMVENEGMDHMVYDDEPVGLAAPIAPDQRRRLAADPFLLARKLSAAGSGGGFGAKFSENGGPDYCTSIERLESSLTSTTEVSRTASSGSLAEEANEDVYTLLGTLLQHFYWNSN